MFDYFTAAGIDSDDPSPFVVWGEADESDRVLEEVIDPADYGKRLIVAVKGEAA